MKKYFEFALDNVSKYGDTDIFPFPIENIIFYDRKKETIQILEDMLKNFEECLKNNPPINESTLVSAGYTGFRWATQLDPIWNAFYLGLVLSISDKIEKARIPIEKNEVFSYRIKFDEKENTIFDKSISWSEFQKVSIEKAKNNKYVLICDISNFYTNIYHHRLENSLQNLNVDDKRIEKYIMKFLQNISGTKSYGIPIGGQASRILAELLLNRTDKLLRSNKIQFCRFVDDYHIFADTEQSLYENLLFLSKILIENEGLQLQKTKTRILTSEEFINTSPISVKDSSRSDFDRRNIFGISLKYDPYSSTAEEDYEQLKEEIGKIDIIGLLNDELAKSRVHSAIMKRILSSIKYLDSDIKNQAVVSLIENIDILIPVLPNVLLMINSIYESLSENAKKVVYEMIYNMIDKDSYVMKIDLNLLYALRIISKHKNFDTETLLINIYKRSDVSMIRRDIIIILSNWNCDYWISDLKNKFVNLNEWEKRMFILASYNLGDEGSHWREHNKKGFSQLQSWYAGWMGDRKGNGKGANIPL